MKSIETLTQKECLDLIKTLAGDLNRPIFEFNDYVKKIEISAGIGSTCNKINILLIKKHEPYFNQAYDEGRKEMAKLIMKMIWGEYIGAGYTRELEINNASLRKEIKKYKGMFPGTPY